MNQRILLLTCLTFSVTAFLAAITRFASDKETLQAQAISWFLVSLGTAMIPGLKYLPSAVESIRFGQDGVKVALKELKEELSTSIQQINDKVSNIDLRVMETLDQVIKTETTLSKDTKERRQRIYDSYAINVLNNMSDTERLAAQEGFTRQHLAQHKISISQLKKLLNRLGFYHGSIDENFNGDLAQAVTEFQLTHLPGVPDGIAGSITLSRIREVYSSKFS